MSRRMRVKAAARNPRCRQCSRDGGSSGGGCITANVVEQDPEDGGSSFTPNSSSIFFDRDVTVNSFTVSISGGVPFGNVPGGFVYDSGTKSATFTASPLLPGGLGGNATSTVVVDQGTPCEQTIVWHWTVQAG